MKVTLILLGCFLLCCCESENLPLKFSPNNTNAETCSSILPVLPALEKLIKDEVTPILNNRYGNICSSRNGWIRVVNVDMSSANSTCPAGWLLSTNAVRGCGRNGNKSTSSALFPVDFSYTQVCGRVSAIQKGTPNAFARSVQQGWRLNVAYVDGVSLTYRSPSNNREHIWTFANGFAVVGAGQRHRLCPCAEGGPSSPQFVGSHYFCDFGTRNTPQNDVYYINNTLWDGQGCIAESNKCCEFNSPPWFFATLPGATSSDLEMRILSDEKADNEDIIVTEIEIFVQ